MTCKCKVVKTEKVYQPTKLRDHMDRGIMIVKEFKCPMCVDYTNKRNEHIAEAIATAHRKVPELRHSKPETKEREQATNKWNRVYHNTMNELCAHL